MAYLFGEKSRKFKGRNRHGEGRDGAKPVKGINKEWVTMIDRQVSIFLITVQGIF